ncbi:MAG: peroxidase-related enzyme [Aquabacterium sp.]|nr:peroxidase-related enzyme [Aquabacterium sp.]
MTAEHPLPAAADVVDACVPLLPGQPTHAVRHGRAKVVAATQASHDGLVSPAVDGISVAERLAAAMLACTLSEAPALAMHYRRLLQTHGATAAAWAAAIDAGQWPALQPARLATLLGYTAKLIQRPIDGDRAAVQALVHAGLSTPAIVALAQLIAFVSYQVRLVAGLQAMAAAEALPAQPPQPPAVPPAPVLLPSPLHINGFTDDIPPWAPWLDTVDVAQATPEQLAALDEMSPTARQSPYFLLLAHQPAILLHRSVAFNAIMFAPGGLSRAERELGAAVESRLNGCVYCTAVHAHRFTQLARRNDVIAQLFEQPAGAGCDARERAVVRFSARLGLLPHELAAADVAALSAVGLAAVDVLDLVHAVALFAWANRLMLNLGEAVLPGAAPGA